MAEIKYSKKIVSKIIDGVGGKEPRKYQINKLGAAEVSIEGFKLIKVMTPSVGVGIDSLVNEFKDEFAYFDNSQAVSGMLQLLSENLTVEHYSELVDKLLGSLCIDGGSIVDWSEHFDDHPEDFLEVLAWTLKENFYSFFVQSTILQPYVQMVKEVVLPKVTEAIENVLRDQEPDYKEK